MIVLYILLALVVFGFLIFVHEGGHYVFARLFKVSIKEFSIGMGPKIFTKESKKTGIKYSLSCLPIGGYLAMVGEDEESEDPNAFLNKPVWQRILVTIGGPLFNIISGFLIMVLLVTFSSGLLATNVVSQFEEDSMSYKSGLMVGDEIVEIGTTPVHIGNELVYEVVHQGTKPVDITVLRNGEKVVIKDVEFGTATESGVTYGMLDFKIYGQNKTFFGVIKHSFYRSVSTVKMIWESLIDLFTGKYGIEAISGPVGVTKAIGEAASYGFETLVYVTVVISINLGMMNLFPFPALDGGRFIVLLIELIFRKKLNSKVEATINYVGLIILLVFMAFITCKDIIQLF